MKQSKRKALEKRGWVVSDATEFLKLSEEEAILIDLKLTLARSLRDRREEQHLSQEELAKRLGSSQSRIAKMEAGDRSVSIELLLRALLQLGTTRRELARIIGSRRAA
jgi:DNA-binding XRE family transcriptional regulator